MVGDDFATRYMKVRQQLAKYINEHKDEDIEKIIALFSVNTGISTKKLRQYVEELKLAGLI